MNDETVGSGWGGPRPDSGPKQKWLKIPIGDAARAAQLSGFDTPEEYATDTLEREVRNTLARENGEQLCSVCEWAAADIECPICHKHYCDFHYAKTHIGEDEPFEK